jgi:hypothetical protein
MSETLIAAVDADLHAIRRVAHTLEPVPPHERRSVQRDEAAAWVERAKVETVRALAAEVQKAVGGDEVEDEPWERIGLFVRPEARAKIDQALALAGKALGAATPKWQRVEAHCEEYLGARWDDLLGHLAMLLRQLGLWRDMQFVSFSHYCAERLGLSERAISQRVALERRLYELPALRTALRDGRVTYEKARIVAAHADEQSLDSWIGRASRLTCVALAREAEADEEAQTCARGEVSWRLPARVVSLLEEAIRAALHVHHVLFRSHDGALVEESLVSLCAAHHLHGVHAGYLRVVGAAPHRLRWSFSPGGGPALGPVVVEAPGLAAA